MREYETAVAARRAWEAAKAEEAERRKREGKSASSGGGFFSFFSSKKEDLGPQLPRLPDPPVVEVRHWNMWDRDFDILGKEGCGLGAVLGCLPFFCDCLDDCPGVRADAAAAPVCARVF
jgi:hypothetical protein